LSYFFVSVGRGKFGCQSDCFVGGARTICVVDRGSGFFVLYSHVEGCSSPFLKFSNSSSVIVGEGTWVFPRWGAIFVSSPFFVGVVVGHGVVVALRSCGYW